MLVVVSTSARCGVMSEAALRGRKRRRRDATTIRHHGNQRQQECLVPVGHFRHHCAVSEQSCGQGLSARSLSRRRHRFTLGHSSAQDVDHITHAEDADQRMLLKHRNMTNGMAIHLLHDVGQIIVRPA